MNIKKMVNVFLAIIATMGIIYYLNMRSENVFVNNIMCIPILVLYYHMYSKMEKRKKNANIL